ncbi:MAG: hypothetical protein NT072_02655 [Deltaproteobacteria bacterium]|nr:hypothetical protein [Deltaproteobacteria bacterium]
MTLPCKGCGIKLEVLVNFRRYYRKVADFRGFFWREGEKDIDDAHDMRIVDVSKHGMGFLMIKPVKINVNDMLHLEFRIKSQERMKYIEKDVVVKRVIGNFVGTELVRPVGEQDKELAFFLF